jgi:sulfate adenylyltransferase subunit 1
MDLVGYSEERFAAIVADFVAFAERTGIGGVRFVPLSALTGDMVVDRGDNLPWYDGPTLLQILETAEAPSTLAAGAFRFPVQYVSRPTEALPRGYMGRVEAGSIAVGDAVTVLPSGRITRVRDIRTWDGRQTHALLHDAVTLVLEDAIDVSRGDMLVAGGPSPVIARSVEATLCWLGEAALDTRRAYLLRHTTREVRARVERIDHLWNVSTQHAEPAPAALAMNDIGRVAFRLAQPIFTDPYATHPATGSFILIDETTNATVAAGMLQ